jgi:hypothetical protein
LEELSAIKSASKIHPRPHSGPNTEQTAADNQAPSPQQFPCGSLMLCIDAQGKLRVCSAATTPCAPDHERQPKDGDLLLKVNGTYVGIAEDPRAVLESILRHALASSGQHSAKLTFARPSPGNSGSSWLTFSFELPLQPHTYDKLPLAALRLHVPSSCVPRKKSGSSRFVCGFKWWHVCSPTRKSVKATCEQLQDIFFEMDTDTCGLVTAEQASRRSMGARRALARDGRQMRKRQ